MGFSNFRDYAVWNRAISLAKEVHRISELLPNKEMFGLRDQMSRAATSSYLSSLQHCRRAGAVLLKNLSGFSTYPVVLSLKYRHN